MSKLKRPADSINLCWGAYYSNRSIWKFGNKTSGKSNIEKCIKKDLELEESYYSELPTIEDVKYSSFVKIHKNKPLFSGVRLDGRKGPIGKVVIVCEDFVIAKFDPNKVQKYVENKKWKVKI